MMRRIVFTIVVCVFSLAFVQSVHAAVLINEIFPKTDPANSAFVELYNNGSSRVDLHQWRLENVSSPATFYILNASSFIEPNGFLVFSRPQTGITFHINGDTVKFIDRWGTIVDNQSYLGTLGFNIAMGRSADGSGVWTFCTEATPGKQNVCPQPSPTATPTPTPVMPTATPTPTPTPVIIHPTPTPTIISPLSTVKPVSSSRVTFGQIAGIQTETSTITPTATPTATMPPLLEAYHFAVEKLMLFQVIAVLVGWTGIAIIAMIRKNRKK